jgi:hypothetical protein
MKWTPDLGQDGVVPIFWTAFMRVRLLDMVR